MFDGIIQFFADLINKIGEIVTLLNDIVQGVLSAFSFLPIPVFSIFVTVIGIVIFLRIVGKE